MKTRQFTKWSFVIISAFTFIFYVENIFALSKSAGSADMAAKTNVRLSHARELLGSSYNGSPAEQSSASNQAVSKFVYATFKQKLNDKKWARYAGAVSATLIAESEKRGFDPIFVMAVIQTESQFDPSIIGSHGEIGLMQIKPDTAQWIAQKEGITWKGNNTLKNPSNNVKIGIAYMSFLRKNFEGAATRYVAAYNMGPKNVRRLVAQSIVPKDYATRVMTNYHSIYNELVKNVPVAKL